MKRYLIATALMMTVGLANANQFDPPKTYTPCVKGDDINKWLEPGVVDAYPKIYSERLWHSPSCSYTVFFGNYSRHVEVYIKDKDGTNKKVVICDTHWLNGGYLPYTCQALS